MLCAICGEEITGIPIAGLKKGNTILVAPFPVWAGDEDSDEEENDRRADEATKEEETLVSQGWERAYLGRECAGLTR